MDIQYVKHYQSPLGEILLAADKAGITGLWFAGQKYSGWNLDPEHKERDLPVFERAGRWLDIYFSGREPDFTVPIHLKGTAFQKEVWEILRMIPYGETMTYGDIAERVAADRGLEHMSPRAVGGAAGHNPVSILVPCHRVVGMDGSLTGYAGGLEKKIKLLILEGVDMSRFSVPGKGTAP